MEFAFEGFARIADVLFCGFRSGAEDPDAERLLLRHAGVGAFARGDAQRGVRFGPVEGAAGVFALFIAVAVSGVVVARAGLMRKKYVIEDMETERFLRQFGIKLSDILQNIDL